MGRGEPTFQTGKEPILGSYKAVKGFKSCLQSHFKTQNQNLLGSAAIQKVLSPLNWDAKQLNAIHYLAVSA